MTKDEILSMAEKVGATPYTNRMDDKKKAIFIFSVDELERFAALVAEKATEQANARQNASWARMCEKMVAAEREACAKVCEDVSDQFHAHAMDCVVAIRERGQKEYRGARLVLTKDGVIQDGWMGDK